MWVASSILPGLALCAVAAAGACERRPRASAAQCEKLVDRYVDLELSEDPGAPAMSTEQRARLRGALAVDVSRRPDLFLVKTRCATDVTDAAYRCAVSAQTTSAWHACIPPIE